MKHAKYMAIIFLPLALLLIGFTIQQYSFSTQPESKIESVDHTYASWDTMEFDKCVAAWMIIRFIDKDARFVFYPQGSEINREVPFDVPGADWSRKHRKCTSQCILEMINKPDPAIEKIVLIASKTELNFWQLDRWPDAHKCFYEVKEIMDQYPEPGECFERTFSYFDNLYSSFNKDSVADNDEEFL